MKRTLGNTFLGYDILVPKSLSLVNEPTRSRWLTVTFASLWDTFAGPTMKTSAKARGLQPRLDTWHFQDVGVYSCMAYWISLSSWHLQLIWAFLACFRNITSDAVVEKIDSFSALTGSFIGIKSPHRRHTVRRHTDFKHFLFISDKANSSRCSYLTLVASDLRSIAKTREELVFSWQVPASRIVIILLVKCLPCWGNYFI